MRADLPDAIARAIDACERPTLVFDRDRIAANLRELATSARAHGITSLFAAKSFPHPDVWAMAAEHCDGFDAASAGEVAALPAARVLSIVDPTGRAHAGVSHRGRLIVGCETIAQVEAAPSHAEIAIRISSSITRRDPAIGAVLDGTGHRRSRFGLDVRGDKRPIASENDRATASASDELRAASASGELGATASARIATASASDELRATASASGELGATASARIATASASDELRATASASELGATASASIATASASDELRAMVRAANGRPVGLHVHHGPVTATSAERFVATARAVLDLAREASVEPGFLDVGGAWHAIADLDGAFAQLRAAVPKEIELIVEPGRVIAREAGFACGRVVVARELTDRSLRVVDLSRSCHLRWSQVELVGNAPHAGTGRDVLVVGPTCYEDDVIGEWTITPGMLDEGARVVLRGVTGYALAWNTSFGGVPAADVLV